MRGKQFWEYGQLKFTTESFCDALIGKGFRDARTRVAVSFNHSGVVYCDTNHNLSLALTRQTANRFAVEPKDGKSYSFSERIKMEMLEYWYDRNQRLYLSTIIFDVSDFHYDDVDWRELATLHHADPHQKRLLRIEAYRKIVSDAKYYKPIWRDNKGFRLKLKRLEYAKYGKYARTIGDFGVSASLQGAFFVNYCKEYLASRDFRLCSGRHVRYVKSPTDEHLNLVFNDINHARGSVCAFAHSDDGLYRTKKGRIYKLDISKCDGSHSTATYDFLCKLFPDADNCMRTLVNQLLEPVSIYSEKDKFNGSRQRVLIRALRPILYSGSTLTTLINTVALFCIYDALERFEVETPDEILSAAAQVGYILGEPEECIQLGDQQFLKHSPIIYEGRIQSLFNFGPLLRTYGTVKYDIVGKLDFSKIKEAGLEYNHGLVQGMFPDFDVPILNKMKALSRAPGRKLKKQVLQNLKASLPYEVGASGLKMSDMLFFSRYSATQAEIDNLHLLLDEARNFDVIHDALVRRILKMDYGL